MACNLCNSLFIEYDYTNIESPNLARLNIANNKMIIQGDKNEIELKIKYCPKCGRRLNEPPVLKSKQEYSNIIKNNTKEQIKHSSLSVEEIAQKTNISKEAILGEKELFARELAEISDTIQVPIEQFYK